MKGGAERAAREAREACGKAAECEDKVKEAMAKALGRNKDEIKQVEMKKIASEGAKKAAGAKARACAEAKKANTSAVCEDLLESFMELTGAELPADPKKK